MSDSVNRRLGLGFASGLLSKSATSLIQLIQVPVFLHFWSVPMYGEWMLITSIPAYLSFSNFGFGSAAGTDMTINTAAGKNDVALRVFQSCWWLIVAICLITGLVFASAITLLPVAHIFKLHTVSASDSRWILAFLGCSILFAQLESLLQAAYTCIGRFAYGSYLKSCMSLFAFACMMVPVIFHHGPRDAALAYALGNIAGTVYLALRVKHDLPWIEFGFRHVRISEIKRLASPAIAYMGFPIGTALNLQGSLMAVGYSLGPTDIVIFGTARTVSRIALQMIQMVNNSFWPELSKAYGEQNEVLVRSLHRRACQMALAMAAMFILLVMLCGPWFLSHWTAGHVRPDRALIGVLLLVVVFYCFWSTSSTLMVAINQHQKIATYYLIDTGITLAVIFIFAKHIGLVGVAGLLLACELVMSTYVLPKSLAISRDTFTAFCASLFSWPSSLNLNKILIKLRRTAPASES